MKLVGNKVSYSTDDMGNLIVSLNIPRDMYQNQANARKVVQGLKEVDLISCELKVNEKSRSYEQNALLWEIIGKISEHENGTRRTTETWRIYAQLLIKANIKYTEIRALTKAKDILESSFRAVVEIPNSSKNTSIGESKLYWAFYGSSTYTTKEMTLLIDCALDWAGELGVEL
jgi:hypothetical protein